MKKRCVLAALLISAMIGLTGCGMRTRVLPADTEPLMQSGEGEWAAAQGSEQVNAEDADVKRVGQSVMDGYPDDANEPDPNAPTHHDPDAERREYAENVSAVLSPDAVHQMEQRTEDDELMPSASIEDIRGIAGAREAESAELTLTETRPMQEAEELGVSDEARKADSMLQYYQTLLTSRLQTLFECQRLYVYWETADEHMTVFKASPEHAVILLAGGYDVSAKRQADRLLVDDGWISRKNPGCVVKTVSQDVLTSTSDVNTIRNELMRRPEWADLEAVKHHRLVLISEELLLSQAGQTAAAVSLACAMYPQLFADIDAQEAVTALLSESAGAKVSGVYAEWERMD